MSERLVESLGEPDGTLGLFVKAVGELEIFDDAPNQSIPLRGSN